MRWPVAGRLVALLLTIVWIEHNGKKPLVENARCNKGRDCCGKRGSIRAAYGFVDLAYVRGKGISISWF